MSFWEEFGQRLTQESQKALQKTRDLASVVTMNADISDSRRKINDLYQELGQLLVKEAFAGNGRRLFSDNGKIAENAYFRRIS